MQKHKTGFILNTTGGVLPNPTSGGGGLLWLATYQANLQRQEFSGKDKDLLLNNVIKRGKKKSDYSSKVAL